MRAETTPNAQTPPPTGWIGRSRRLPTGEIYTRHARTFAVAQYEALPHREGVQAGKLIRIYSSPAKAAAATGTQPSSIKYVADYWLLVDGFGTTEVSIKGWGVCKNPEDLPRRCQVARPSKGRGQWVFKWVALRDTRAHPLAVVFDHRTTLFFEKVKDAVEALAPRDTPAGSFRTSLSAAAAASPMYDPNNQNTSWPEVLTARGRANVYYI